MSEGQIVARIEMSPELDAQTIDLFDGQIKQRRLTRVYPAKKTYSSDESIQFTIKGSDSFLDLSKAFVSFQYSAINGANTVAVNATPSNYSVIADYEVRLDGVGLLDKIQRFNVLKNAKTWLQDYNEESMAGFPARRASTAGGTPSAQKNSFSERVILRLDGMFSTAGRYFPKALLPNNNLIITVKLESDAVALSSGTATSYQLTDPILHVPEHVLTDGLRSKFLQRLASGEKFLFPYQSYLHSSVEYADSDFRKTITSNLKSATHFVMTMRRSDRQVSTADSLESTIQHINAHTGALTPANFLRLGTLDMKFGANERVVFNNWGDVYKETLNAHPYVPDASDWAVNQFVVAMPLSRDSSSFMNGVDLRKDGITVNGTYLASPSNPVIHDFFIQHDRLLHISNSEVRVEH